MNIGLKIKQIRLDNHLTQVEFAKKISISRSSLINYENNKRQIPINVLITISQVFNIKMDELTNFNSEITYEEAKTLNDAGMINDVSVINSSSDDLKLENFKEFLEKHDFPVNILNASELEMLHTKTIEYIEFELSRLGYFKVSAK